jgi:flagellar basal-body rod protein FlgC
MEVISNNIANVNTTRTPDGGPFRRKIVLFAPILKMKGVRVVGIMNDNTEKNPLRLKYDPSHPDANEQGYVLMPNVNIVTEMVDMISATRAYQANVAAINAAKGMLQEALGIARRV